MKEHLNFLGVADVVLIRHCLAFYEERLLIADRPEEPAEVTLSVVQTLDSLRRLDRRLRGWIQKADLLIMDTCGEGGSDDDIPF